MLSYSNYFSFPGVHVRIDLYDQYQVHLTMTKSILGVLVAGKKNGTVWSWLPTVLHCSTHMHVKPVSVGNYPCL